MPPVWGMMNYLPVILYFLSCRNIRGTNSWMGLSEQLMNMGGYWSDLAKLAADGRFGSSEDIDVVECWNLFQHD